ncbi:MAG: carbohydrate ABC transporter permease [Chloroflexi bacterium]|nr:carbohydrate ABC transporter permease [Chloroflexota bacterium]
MSVARTGAPIGDVARARAWRWPSLSQVGFNLALVGFSLVVLVPLVWMVSSSLKTPEEYYQRVPSLWVAKPTLINYVYMWTRGGKVPLFMANSVIVTVGAVSLQVLMASLAGYAFARLDFRGRDALFLAIVVSMFIPRSGGLMALYELMSFLHLRNNLFGLVLLFGAGLPVPIFIMRQTFLAMPRELEDAARMDGASWWQLFWRIAVPLGASGMVVIAIIGFVYVWGEYLVTFTMVDNEQLLTISVAARTLLVGGSAQGWVAPQQQFLDKFATEAADAALLLMAVAPVILVYLFLQRWFVRGLTEGVLKL